MSDVMSRSWFAVFNNPSEHGYEGEPQEVCERLRDEWLAGSDTRSGAWVYCISAAGMHHIHMVLEDVKNMRFTAIKKSYALGMHFEATRGNKKEAEDYIQKVGKWQEKGEQVLCTVTAGDIKGAQGRRNDLNRLYDLIKEGLSDYEILEENPQFLKYLTVISKVRETLRFEEFRAKRRTDLRVEYWWGPSGSGKTSGVLNMYGDDKVYIVSDYSHPWDGYQGQDVVLFDDMDPHRIRSYDLLRWLDIYPLELPCRFNNKVACYTKVYITSNLAPADLWREERLWNEEVYNALLRRVHLVKEVDGIKMDENGFFILPEAAQRELDEMFGSCDDFKKTLE